MEEDKSNHLREIIYCNVIDNETEIKSNDKPDNEICDNTNNEIDNGNDPDDDFKERKLLIVNMIKTAPLRNI